MNMFPKIKITLPVLLLPLFFVFHGYVDFFDLVTLKAGVSILISYWLAAMILLLLFRFLLRTWEKSALFSFCLLFLEFFFGGFQDTIKKYLPESFLNRYATQLSLIGISLLVIFLLIRRSRNDLKRPFYFLNLLLPSLIAIDTATLIYKISNLEEDPTIGNRAPLTEGSRIYPRPDIYFIITDGYSGSSALRTYFNYNNNGFENELRSRGFYVADSSFSNYNYTVFSVASTLNMDYLRADGYFDGKTDLPKAFKALRDNPTLNFLKTQGYEFKNYSIFDFQGHPTQLVRRLMKYDKSPITTQTFIYRVWNDLGYHIFSVLGIKTKIWEEVLNIDYQNNILADSLTKAQASINKKSVPPFFVYTHLVMPHVPYYFDSLGNRFPNWDLDEKSQSNKERYINYLVYVNKKLLSLIDNIINLNGRPAIIILLGDHGCRDCLENTDGEKAEALNLNAILLPRKNYKEFYKGMSNVNEFRLIFNNSFGEHLTILKDSSVHIRVEDKSLH